MAADALASCVPRSLQAMVLANQDNKVITIHEDGFTLPVPSILVLRNYQKIKLKLFQHKIG